MFFCVQLQESAPSTVKSSLAVNTKQQTAQWRKSAPFLPDKSPGEKPSPGPPVLASGTSFSQLQADFASMEKRMVELEKKYRADIKRLSGVLREETIKRKAMETELQQARRSRPKLRLT